MRPVLVTIAVALATAGALVAATPRPVPVKPDPAGGAWIGTVGVSPGSPELAVCNSTVCPIAGSSIALLKANATRRALSVQNAGAANLFCCLGPTCTTTAYDLLLLPGEIESLPGPTVWGGPVSCASSGTSASISSLALGPAADLP